MNATFINDLVIGNCDKYISLKNDTGLYDSTKQSMQLVKTDIGTFDVPNGEPLLVGYLTLDGAICGPRGDLVAKFSNYGRNKFEILDASNNLLGSGNFQGYFETNKGEQYVCPVLSNLANKAKKLIHSQQKVA